jgi:large subunit ribosomal protein L24
MSLRIRRGDKVKVLAGKDKGKSGKVLHVYPVKGRALVEGINLVKKHLRRSQQHPQGAVVSQEASVHLSNLALSDPQSGKPVRFRTATAADGSKSRIASKTQAVITS